jgi:polysaccharide export outer membrane protein
MNHRVRVALGLLLLATAPVFAQDASVQPVASKLASSEPVADTQSQANTPQLQQRDMRYRLAAGDSFDVSFELSPEFNQTVVVQPDGFVTLKAVGDVKVVGQTVPELTQTLRSAYSRMLNDPLIVVVLKDFEKPYFIAD